MQFLHDHVDFIQHRWCFSIPNKSLYTSIYHRSMVHGLKNSDPSGKSPRDTVLLRLGSSLVRPWSEGYGKKQPFELNTISRYSNTIWTSFELHWNHLNFLWNHLNKISQEFWRSMNMTGWETNPENLNWWVSIWTDWLFGFPSEHPPTLPIAWIQGAPKKCQTLHGERLILKSSSSPTPARYIFDTTFFDVFCLVFFFFFFFNMLLDGNWKIWLVISTHLKHTSQGWEIIPSRFRKNMKHISVKTS